MFSTSCFREKEIQAGWVTSCVNLTLSLSFLLHQGPGSGLSLNRGWKAELPPGSGSHHTALLPSFPLASGRHSQALAPGTRWGSELQDPRYLEWGTAEVTNSQLPPTGDSPAPSNGQHVQKHPA